MQEPEGFAFGVTSEEEVGLGCMCDDGFDFNGSQCERIPIVPTSEPHNQVIREVNVTTGKVRLVADGTCSAQPEMAGRIEYQVQKRLS